MNTIAPQLNGWGNMPKDRDRSLSANIDRIRIFKNEYVSHCSNMSLDQQDYLQTWQEIRKCIIEIGGDDYMMKIDSLLTTEINPVMETELCNTIRRLKEADRQHELTYNRFKGMISISIIIVRCQFAIFYLQYFTLYKYCKRKNCLLISQHKMI